MLEKVQSKLRHWDIDSRDKVLLAFSGGLDSRCLLEILLSLGYEVEIVHCNFQLRGEASDQDEVFCRELAQVKGIKAHFARFDTTDHALKHGLSTQMAARNLRYDFFAKLHKQAAYRAIFTAHHADDQIETVLFKLARGTGLEAISGIPDRRGIYYRPLLEVYRSELEAYAQQMNLVWREDLSNQVDKYLRNTYRLKLIPYWQKIQANFKEKVLHSSYILKEQSDSLGALLDEKLATYLQKEDDEERLYYSELKNKAYWNQLLFRWLEDKGKWDWAAVNELANRKKGRYTYNEDWLISQDNGFLRISKQSQTVPVDVEIKAQDRSVKLEHLELQIKLIQAEDWQLDPRPENHYLDFDQLQFPLRLRNWREGDHFRPLGMSGKKKVSDYLIDQKTPIQAKARQMVIESTDNIVALLGERIDDRYKVKNSTKTIYFVRLRHTKTSS